MILSNDFWISNLGQVSLYFHKSVSSISPSFPYSPNYFTNVKVSAVALLKLVMHACAGGREEVIGILQGKTEPHTFYILDAFALPVKGTETRVNPGNAAIEYQYQYTVG